MWYNSLRILAPLLLVLITSNLVVANIDHLEIYYGCGEQTKTCFGDVDGCVKTRNCTFVVSAYENSTHYTAVIQNICNIKETNVFFGVGASPLFKTTTEPTPRYTCLPKFSELKYFILWDGDKCVKHGTVEKRWGFMSKGSVKPCSSSEPVGNLLKFVQTKMLVSTGNFPASRIVQKRYQEQTGRNGETFYVNSASNISPAMCILAAALFLFKI